MEIPRVDHNNHIFLSGYFDTQNNVHENLFMFGSKDGEEWKFVSSFKKAYHNSVLVMVGENENEGIILRTYPPVINEIIQCVEE